MFSSHWVNLRHPILTKVVVLVPHSACIIHSIKCGIKTQEMKELTCNSCSIPPILRSSVMGMCMHAPYSLLNLYVWDPCWKPIAACRESRHWFGVKAIEASLPPSINRCTWMIWHQPVENWHWVLWTCFPMQVVTLHLWYDASGREMRIVLRFFVCWWEGATTFCVMGPLIPAPEVICPYHTTNGLLWPMSMLQSNLKAWTITAFQWDLAISFLCWASLMVLSDDPVTSRCPSILCIGRVMNWLRSHTTWTVRKGE